jgi:PKD repeat protein
MKTLFFIACLIVSTTGMSQNWMSVNGNNQRNGLSKITGPTSVGSSYWSISNSGPTDLGANIYSYHNRFVNSRISFSPVYQAVIECRNVHTGALLWQSPFISSTSILFADGFDEFAVYAHDYDTDSLYALNPADGGILWTCPVTSMSFAPMDGLFFSCEGDLIINGPDPVISTMRVNHLTGDTLWTNNNIISVTPSCVMAVNDTIVYRIDGSIVTPKRLYAIDISTGATKYYSAAIPGDGDQENPLTIGPDGTIYFWRDGGFVYAFRDNGSGFTQLWTYAPVSVAPGFTNISIGADGNVLLLDNGTIHRLDHSTGIVMDSSQATFPQARITVGADSTVYVNDQTNMYYALSHDLQTIKWSLQVNGNYYAGPALSEEGVFIACGAGTTITAYRDSVSIAPVADFMADTTFITTSDSLDFTDQSSFAPTSWSWNFPGGNPSSSTLQNPQDIVYSSPGTYEVTLVASNANGSDSLTKKCYIEVVQLNDISSIQQSKDLFIYPNPASNYIMVRNAGNNIIEWYDGVGRCLRRIEKTAGDVMIDISGFSEGIYFIRSSDKKNSITRNFIISR